MASNTDWGRKGAPGFARDPHNEQVGTLAAGGTFTGQWSRVDSAASFVILYGTHVPFTMQIQWSADGVTRDPDPFATITPQVRNRLGLYSVISFQSTFFRPFYRIVITNGASPQLFAVSDALLLSTVFPGYQIDIDGPIPVLGLANLNIGLGWARTPTGWEPIQLTAAKNQKIALAENLLGDLPVVVTNPPETGVAKEVTLAQVLTRLGDIHSAVDGLEVTAGNIEISSGTINLQTDEVESLLRTLRDTLATQATLAAVLTKLNAGITTSDVIAGGSFTHLTAVGTTVLKPTAGVLERIIVNRISAAGVVLLTVYNGLTVTAPVMAVVAIGATAPGSSGVAAPASLDYFAAFTTGLTVAVSAVGADVTVVWR